MSEVWEGDVVPGRYVPWSPEFEGPPRPSGHLSAAMAAVQATLVAELEDCIPGVESEGTSDLATYQRGSGNTVQVRIVGPYAGEFPWRLMRVGDAQSHDPGPDRCWRCDAARSETDVGLCPTCHADLTAS